MKGNYSVPNISDNYEFTPEAYKEIFRIVNRRRPYEPSDFIKEYYIADI